MDKRKLHLPSKMLHILFILLLSVVGMTQTYADVTIGNLNYSLNSYSMTATVTGHKDGTSATGNLIIPSSVTYGGQTYSVTSIDNNAFRNCSGLTGSLNIPNSVTFIGGYAFENCSGFTGSLVIPNSVTTMGGCVFNGCSGFSGSLTIGNSMTSIGNGVFADCSGITGNLTIPNSVTSIGNYAFDNCNGLTGSVTISNSVTSIGYNPFSGCTGLEQIIVASNNPIYDSRDNCNAIIKTSTNTLISGCKNTVIPNSVTAINPSAFLNCSSFTGQLVIPNSVTLIGSDAFHNCSGLTGNLTIPNSVITIEYQAFMNCSGFTGSLTIGNSVTTIGEGAFRGCSGFTGNLNIPNSVTSIGSIAFYNCTGFNGSLTIPNSLTSIGSGVFSHCSGLTGNLTIPNTVTMIGNSAFSGCSSFTGSLIIPNSVTEIGDYAFWGCSGFTGSLTIPNSVTVIEDATFCDCSGFTGDLIIPNSVTTIGNIAFSGCSGFTGSLTIPNSVTSIGSSAFSRCSGFTGNLVIPNSVTSIGSSAFYNCTGFNGSLTIPNSVTSIGDRAFWGCMGLTGPLTIPNSVTSIGDVTFSGCSGFTGSLTIPNSVTTIGNNAFQNCSGFTGSLTIPNTVTTMGSYAFMGCSGFTGNLTIGNSVTEIGDYAFWGCSGFTGSLTIPNTVTTIGSYAFIGCSGFTGNLTIGNSVTSIGSDAFRGCSNFTLMTVLVETPPALGNGSVFYNVPKTIPAYVPCGFEEEYTSVSWGGFDDFIGLCGGTVAVIADPEECGTVTGGGQFEASQLCTVTAIANLGYAFAHWTFNGLVVSFEAEYTFFVAGDMSLVAHFVPDGNIVFADANVKSVCVANWDTNGDGELSYAEAAAVTDLGQAFIGNTEITSFEELRYFIELTSIRNYAFSNCSNLSGSLYIPNSVTTIGNYAFQNCSGLTESLTIGNSVTAIGEGSFQNCSGFMGSLTIGSSVSTIGNYAFLYCSGLTSMTVLAETPPALGISVFYSVPKAIPVYVPCGSLSAYQNAEGWNEFTNIQEACDTFIVTAMANPTEGGSVTGVGTYTEGTTCTLIATANGGYNFVNWTENNEVVSTNANYSFTVSGNRNLVANFALSGTITNHWTPEGSSYSEIMAMYSVIQIDGVEQYSNTLEVGVFCGDECRGSAIASEFNLTHRYLAILNVFGENGHQLTFKLYDHSIGQELDLTPPAAVSFDFNGYGNPVEPYVLNFTSSITHTQALNSGWNWWSTYIEQDGIDGLGMLENSIGSAGVRIQGRNGTIDQFEYQGSSYWYGSLSSIENEQMYKIRTNAACNAVMVGHAALPANHPININGGWNWIGFPCNQSVSVNDAMSGFTPVANDVIKGRNGSTTYVSYGSTSLWYGTLNTLEPGQGYMYKSNSNTSKTLVFQTGRGEETLTDVTEENSFFTPNTDDFSDNMLVTAVIDLDGQELRSEDYEVAAYVGNECRGSVGLMYVEPFDRYVAFLLVFGEAEEEIHFVLTDGNNVAWSDGLLTYTADGMEGTVTEPVTLHFGTLGLNDNEHDFVNIFPNPSNGIFNIEGNELRKIEVVNAFGQTVLLREVENNIVQIDLSGKAAGVYLLRVITNNGITTKQIVKE